jgi:hypothetical protein
MSNEPTGNLVIYQTEDGRARIECRLVDATVWLSQARMGELFDRSKKTISEHLQNLFEEGELDQDAVVRNFRTTAADGRSYDVAYYNLEAILAVGFRVKSPRGTQFRRWANSQLRELIVKGFVMDDERLKNPGGWDYFDELLARIREIRASEKRFYQKVRDLFALSSDYQIREQETSLFFTEVQNKLLYAATRQTAAELIVARADPRASPTWRSPPGAAPASASRTSLSPRTTSAQTKSILSTARSSSSSNRPNAAPNNRKTSPSNSGAAAWTACSLPTTSPCLTAPAPSDKRT